MVGELANRLVREQLKTAWKATHLGRDATGEDREGKEDKVVGKLQTTQVQETEVMAKKREREV